MTLSDMMNIGLMQGFAGLSLFAVLLLMGLGLAIIFGQMGVINMAHGEFMTIGAYSIYLAARVTESLAPAFMPYYFPIAIGLAFVFAFIVGWMVEWVLIRHLYKRPLDTLLATWGVSLGLQQVFRTFIGPKEVSPTLPEWIMGSWTPHEGLDIPINGLFVLALTALVTGSVLIALHKSRWGLRVRATVANRTMANATGIDTKKTDRLTFAIGCGIAGMAGAAFTTIGSTGPTSGSLYIVDAFLVVTFGGAASLLGTVVSAFGIAQTQSITEFFMTGSMAKVLTLSLIVLILMMRPQGLSPSRCAVDEPDSFLENVPMNFIKASVQRYQLGSLLLLVVLLAVVLPLSLDIFRLNLVGKYLTYAFVAVGLVMVWGYGGVLSLGQGVFFGIGGYAMAMFLKLEASDPSPPRSSPRPASRTSWTGTRSPSCPRCGCPSRACR
jgi:urea transport system permease protein